MIGKTTSPTKAIRKVCLESQSGSRGSMNTFPTGKVSSMIEQHKLYAREIVPRKCKCWWKNMAWTKLEYSKGQVDRAGNALITLPKDNPAREEAVTIVDNWRACHSYPLQVVKMTLRVRAKKIDQNAVIAQRLKRRPSIEIKLRDNPNMKLSQMQDIAGCRAVMRNVADVNKLINAYEESFSKSRKGRPEWDGSKDFNYINNPKNDGYRSIHLIVRYNSSSKKHSAYKNQRVEVQIRSKLQHFWATAVETAQVFTGQALKSRVKRANKDWLRFFSLVSSIFARSEKCQIVPDTPENASVLIRELRQILKRENIMDNLRRWSDTIHQIEEKIGTGDDLFLLVLDPSRKSLSITTFKKDKISDAEAEYKREEKETENDPNIQVVLVSVESVDSLRKAYPNYYVDTREFINAVEKEMRIKRRKLRKK